VETCQRCGHPLGVGRFCLNCGYPAAGEPTDTAERPAVADPPRTGGTPVTPPPVLQAPPEPRFPLFADEVARGPMPSGPPPSGPPPSGPPASPPTGHRAPGTSRPGWLPWAIGAAVLVLVAALGVVLLVTGGDDEEPSARDTTSRSPDPTPTSEAPTPEPTPTPEPEPPTPAEPEDVATRASARVPATAAPNTDVEGNLVRFEARNMLDGVATTCWRMPGDGTGEEIVVTLSRETRLRSVGMINGYAKKGGAVDWYHGNRRIEQVEWVFDDGTTVPQTLGDTAAVQSLDVDVTSTTVTIRLVSVSEPGKGPSRRDFTAISDLLFVAR
jgi:hypothetical protein